MTYLPELRASLVKAADRIHGAAEPNEPTAGRRRRLPKPSFGGLAAALASATAIAVAAVALIVFHHGSAETAAGGGGGSDTAGQEQAARQAANSMLGELALPAGAVKTGLKRGIPASLWKPSDLLATRHRVDVYGVWRLRQSPAEVVRFIEAHRPSGSTQGMSEESGSGPGGSGFSGISIGGSTSASRQRFALQSASFAFNFRPSGSPAVWRELAVHVESLRGGGSALRADAQAGWLTPRPAGERIPAGVERVQVTTSDARGGRVRTRTASVSSPQRIGAMVSLLNALPLAQPASVPCGPSRLQIRYAFYTRDPAPVAVAIVNLACNPIHLALGGGRRWPDLQISLPDGNLIRDAAQENELVSFAPWVAHRRAQRPVLPRVQVGRPRP